MSSASVNLTTETAVIWPVPEAKDSPHWEKQLGQTLANHLTQCGFASSLRGESSSFLMDMLSSRMQVDLIY